jgi:uncharacterized SAM-binding protein YcdF (DUF218 family)
MYFLLSKLLLFLIMPFFWIVFLLVIALISKERKRKQSFLIAAIIVLYIFSNSFLLNQFARRWDVPPDSLKNVTPYSCVIVLGGFSSSDGQGGGFFNNASDRFIQGIKLMATKKASHILISSGNGNLFPGGFKEANWVKTQLHEFNFADSVVLIESNSKNTFENARFTKALLDKTHLQPPYLLVTSAFHMRRSLMIFRKAGMPVIPYPCNYIAGKELIKITDFFPAVDTLLYWNIYIKEVVGYVVNYFK